MFRTLLRGSFRASKRRSQAALGLWPETSRAHGASVQPWHSFWPAPPGEHLWPLPVMLRGLQKGFMEGSWGQRSIVLRRCCDVHAVRGTSGLATTCRMQECRVAPPGLSAEPPARRQPAKNGKMDEFIVSRPVDLNDRTSIGEGRHQRTVVICSAYPSKSLSLQAGSLNHLLRRAGPRSTPRISASEPFGYGSFRK